MMRCPHGLNLKERNCDRCEEVAYAERRDARPYRPTPREMRVEASDRLIENIGLASAEIADRWEEIWGSGFHGRASEDMIGDIIEKHVTRKAEARNAN